MGRRKKQSYDPRQLTFSFDVMASQVEDLKQEAEAEEFTLLGMNPDGVPVYALREGGRMYSSDTRIMWMTDGEKDSPERLFTKRKYNYLTVKEIQAFTRREQEVHHDNRQDPAPRDSKPSAAARNRTRGSAGAAVGQFSLFDSRPLGSQRAGGTSQAGRKEHSGTSESPVRAAGTGTTGAEFIGSSASPGTGRERVGDIGNARSGHARPDARVVVGSPQVIEHQFSLFDPEPARTSVDVAGSGLFFSGRPEPVQEPEEYDDPVVVESESPTRQIAKENYRIAPGAIGTGGVAIKLADNIRAIQLVKQLSCDGIDVATPEEKDILARYVGWGGMPQVFDERKPEWRESNILLRRLLSDEEYNKARRSTQDAHYTSETVIRGIYTGLARLGVQNWPDTPPLSILEPSEGIGNFLGLYPSSWQAQFTAVEQDPLSSQIAQYLYPQASHIQNGYQRVNILENQFDVVLGNPPFGSQRLFDVNHPELRKFSIHNYFLAKSIDKLRPGGVAAFVVSRYFMDAVDSSAREHIAQRADFLGAIRLPESAFRENALTDVTTDIVFFQKTDGRPGHKEWVETRPYSVYNTKEEKWDNVSINAYFVDNPKQIIGELFKSGGQFQDTVNCVAPKDIDLSEEINKRLEVLPETIFVPQTIKSINQEDKSSQNEEFIKSDYFGGLKIGAFCIEPRTQTIVRKINGVLGEITYEPVTLKRETERPRLAGLIGVRDAVRELLDAEKAQDTPPADLMRLRSTLNIRYDAFIKKFGLLNSSTNRGVFRDDPEAALVQSLEVKYDKGLSSELAKRSGREPRRPSAEKAAIFRQRVLEPAKPVTHAETVKDALILCLRESGKINFDQIGELAGKSADEVQQELQRDGLVFLNPQTYGWEIRDRYLTGNVKEKLQVATEAVKADEQFQRNVDALQAAVPPDVETVDIGVQFGAPWIPADVMNQFVEDVIHGGSGSQHIKYLSALGKWEAKVSIYDGSKNLSVWGTPEYPASRLIESLLRGTPIKVERETGQVDERGNAIRVVDSELTAAAMQKADEIRQAFKDWIWIDDDRRIRLTALYNEKFNTHVPPHYDGSHINLINASTDVTLRPHQKNVIWRSIQEGTGLFDHVVGAGKTLACIASIMESRRMGFMKKPMVVVPNHLVYQWRDEFFKLYPDANILVADKSDFIKANRERFFSRVATGEWDAVIVAHSSFKKIEMPRETQEQILKEQIDAIMLAIEEAKSEEGSRATIKQLEKQRERMVERYEALMAKGGPKDKAVDFSDLGIDALFVDESQEFKNLGFATTMNVSGLGNITGSSKALDLFVKCRYLQKKHDGRGVFFLTGTPISNSIAEVYTLQRYLQYDELVKKEVNHFDAWAATYGMVTNGWELDATGVNYKLKSRFASFQNVPELLSMYRTFADVVTKSDLDAQAKAAGLRPLTPPVKGGTPQNLVKDRSPAQAEYMEQIIYRMEHLPPDPRKDNPLKITNDARKAGLDYRLIDPSGEDFAGSKVNAAVERIFELWRDTVDVKGTQLVFCDLSTPKAKGGLTPPVVDVPSVGEEELVELDDDDVVEVAMDDLLAAGNDFSVYDDMKRKLVAKGIPAHEIAFIHDANTDLQKSKLFSDMQNGNVRILFGSTSKMGAGTNVQKRLVAAHHLDAPWRPSDLEQRNGRIIRQGNVLYEQDPDNFSIEINYYATKQTYDARMWQTIEYKAAAIEQFRKGDLSQRVIDDVQGEAANAAEMKAAASGNPLILYQVKLASDLRKLEALASQHKRAQYRLKDRAKYLESSDERFEAAKAIFEANCGLRDSHTTITRKDGRESIQLELIVDGQVLDGDRHKKQIQQHFIEQIQRVPKENIGTELPIGTYRGFEVFVLQRRSDSRNFQFSLRGAQGSVMYPKNLEYVFGDKFSLSGLFQRIDNVLDKGLAKSFEEAQREHAQEYAELKTVTDSLGKGFPQEKELALARENHAAVMRELKRMQDDASYVSEWTPKKLEEAQAEQQQEAAPTVDQADRQAESRRMRM